MDCEIANLRFCSNSKDCFDGKTSTVTCWTVVLFQLILSFTLLVIPPIFTAVRIKINEKRVRTKDFLTAQNAFIGSNRGPNSGNYISCSISKTIRSEENFMKSNFDEGINFPSDYLPEYTPAHSMNFFQFGKVLFRFIITSSEVMRIIRISAGFALMSSSMSSIIAIILKYEDYYGEDLCENSWNVRESLLGYAAPFRATIDSFKFLPIFLVLAYIAFVVERWRMFMRQTRRIMGRIHDLGLLVGAIVPVPVPESTKKRLYKIYRYFNMVHILCYASFIPSWDLSRDGVAEYGMRLGLLTYEEGSYIISTDNKPRDGVMALLTYQIRLLLKYNNENDTQAVVIYDLLIRLRLAMADLHDMFTLVHPNEYILVMHTLAGTFSMLVICGYSILLFHPESSTSISSCFQPMVLIGVFCILVSLYIPVVLFHTLMNPFTENGDGIECIELIACSEKTLFQSLRSLFHIDEEGNIIPLNEADDEFIDNSDPFIANSAVDTNIRGSRIRGSLMRPIGDKKMIVLKGGGGFGEL